MAAEPVSLPTTGELQAALEQAAEWIARYLDNVDKLPVLAQVKPGEIAAALPEHPPAHGEPLAAILADVDRVIVPGLTHWNHPGFMAYFGITGSPPGILGETIAAALNVNAMLWRTSPAATELEQVTLRWAAELLGLPTGWFGQITDTASSSTLWALAAAREAAGLDIRARGMAGRDDLPPLRVYTSEEAHSSVEKACIVLGFGQEGLHQDPDGRRVPDARRRAARRGRRRRRRRPPADRRRGDRRHDVVDEHRPGLRDRRRLRRARHVAARRRGLRRRRRGRAGDARRGGRVRPGRLPGREPAQVAAHAGRLQPALHGPAGGPAGRLLACARVPALERGRRRQPDGLRRRARPPVPLAEAVDGAARLRRGRARGDRGRSRRAGPPAGGRRAVGAGLGAARAGAILDGLLPLPARWRRRRGRATRRATRPFSSA